MRTPCHDDAPGVHSKELVGPRSQLQVNGDILLYTDSRLELGASLIMETGPSEGNR
jgi:hypothetical protein